MRPFFFFVISSIAVAVNGPAVTIWCNGYKLMFQSNSSCGWALNRNNYTRKMSFHPLFVHLSVFRCLSILHHGFHSLLLSVIFCLHVLFLFCMLPLLCFHIIPSSSFVVLCHSFLQCFVSTQPPLLSAFISPPLPPSYEMLQPSFRYLQRGIEREGR